MKEAAPLIIGAGPVGLGAALYLAQANIKTRVIEAAEKPVQESRALAVNPRTLEILESTGITEKMLGLGMPIRGVRFSQRGQQPREILFKSHVHHKYPFVLGLCAGCCSQSGRARSENHGRQESLFFPNMEPAAYDKKLSL